MNTLQERLGVAVESDAARFSGMDFASGHGASVAGRVRRRRAARAAGYGGGTMLAVGAIAVGGARLPWLGSGEGLSVGAADCVTTDASESTASFAPAGATVVYSSTIEVVHGIATVEIPGRASEADPDASEVPSRYVVTYAGGETVTVVPADGEAFDAELGQTGIYGFTGDDGRPVEILVNPERTVVSVSIWATDDESQRLEALSLPPLSPSPDCATPAPEPTHSATPAPSIGGDLAALPLDGSSPFQCGFVFPGPVGSTGVITIGEPRWLTASGAEAAVRSLFEDPDSISLALSGDDVPILVYSSISTWPGMNHGGEAGPTDPAEREGAMTFDVDGTVVYGGFVDGAQFVLEVDDTVIATYSHEDVAAAGATQFLDPAGDGDGTMYGLDLTDGFTACPGVDPASLDGALAVAVAGTKAVEQETVAGPYYAWRYITRG